MEIQNQPVKSLKGENKESNFFFFKKQAIPFLAIVCFEIFVIEFYFLS